MTVVSRRRHALSYMVGIATVVVICFVFAVARHSDSPLTSPPLAPAGPLSTASDPRVLRVCADPNNLPYANDRGEGFENAIAELLAGELGRSLEYHWQPHRSDYVRATIHARACDVLMNVPSTLERVRTTRPYYRSTYVFVVRRDRNLTLRSLDDPQLRNLRIGVQVAGDDYHNPIAAEELAPRQLADRLRSYPLYDNGSSTRSPRSVIDAVAGGQVDVAVVWGPVAGYLAARESVPLVIAPVQARQGRDVVPFAFDMSVGVRSEDVPLHAALDAAISRRSAEIHQILRRFGVPLVIGT